MNSNIAMHGGRSKQEELEFKARLTLFQKINMKQITKAPCYLLGLFGSRVALRALSINGMVGFLASSSHPQLCLCGVIDKMG